MVIALRSSSCAINAKVSGLSCCPASLRKDSCPHDSTGPSRPPKQIGSPPLGPLRGPIGGRLDFYRAARFFLFRNCELRRPFWIDNNLCEGMTTESPVDVKFEIGHVLFMDIVGYSKLLITDQSELLRELTAVVRETEQFRLAEGESKLVQLPTGDGMALVFRNSAEAPVRCAVEISRALKAHPELQLRMGIHSGPVSGVIDVTGRTNLAGAGLNLARRVMECGDAGHILLSKHVAEDLEEYEECGHACTIWARAK
jgi:adenylate/guanylate cyclase family protein